MDEQIEKRCGRCKRIKPLAAFEFRSKGGRQGYCKLCLDEYKRDYYRKNKAAYVDRARRYQQELKANVRAAKDKPCADCGKRYAYYVMDFDHREGETKKGAISALFTGTRWSVPKLLQEIAKCDVVCANCHRERTHQRKQWSRKKPVQGQVAERPMASDCKSDGHSPTGVQIPPCPLFDSVDSAGVAQLAEQ